MIRTDLKYVVNTPEVITPARYLHEFTYPELLEQVKPVVDAKGQLWAGKDRKTELSSESGRVLLWKAWQTSIKQAVAPEVRKEVMAYFQNTKHLSRPPKEGDVGLGDSKPLVETPRFTWSPSKISDFITCPAMFAAKHYYKTVPYQETEAARWGIRVHKAAEDFMLGKPVSDPEAFKLVEKWVKVLEKVPGKRFIEQQMALTDGWKPEANWREGCARMVVDLAIEDGDTVRVWDWKTGRMKDDVLQMKIYALVWALHNPAIQNVSCKYIWLKEGKTTGFDMKREDLLEVFKEVKGIVDQMKTAWENESFPERKNGLCRSWCGNTECPHCGG